MLSPGFVIDHRSWAPGRKTDIDPASLATDRAFTPTTDGGFLMTLSDAEQDEVLRGSRAASHTDLMLSQNNTAGDVNGIVTSEASQGTALAAIAAALVQVQSTLDEVLAALQAVNGAGGGGTTTGG